MARANATSTSPAEIVEKLNFASTTIKDVATYVALWLGTYYVSVQKATTY